MHRTLLSDLLRWKELHSRKPLLLDGARQTGKTYLLQNLLGGYFSKVFRIDFLESPEMADAFAGSLKPAEIIANLELLTETSIKPDRTLIIFDEIGECERALQSLKYFAEQTPEYYIAASGSNIGLLRSFPVGKVEQLKLLPLSFYEFLLASGALFLIKAYEEGTLSSAVHQKMFQMLVDYYFVGGMPEAVKTWHIEQANTLLERVESVEKIQRDLILGFERDFGKYAGAVNAGLIESVFKSVPLQLSNVQDDSVKNFKFKGVYESKSRYSEFENAINWLERCGLVLKNFPIECKPQIPLASYTKPNRVKLFLFDVGLLTKMLGLSYKEITGQAFAYKGFIAENFVQQELATTGAVPSYSWRESRAEIEFLVSDGEGNIIPVEVKSGRRLQAKSLRSYVDRYSPLLTIKLAGTEGFVAEEGRSMVLPLYYASRLGEACSSKLPQGKW